MPINEQPIIKTLTFQVWDASLGDWRDLATKATTINIKRGGSRAGVRNTIDVGTLDATLFGDLDLRTDPALRPNSPIRVVQSTEVVLDINVVTLGAAPAIGSTVFDPNYWAQSPTGLSAAVEELPGSPAPITNGTWDDTGGYYYTSPYGMHTAVWDSTAYVDQVIYNTPPKLFNNGAYLTDSYGLSASPYGDYFISPALRVPESIGDPDSELEDVSIRRLFTAYGLTPGAQYSVLITSGIPADSDWWIGVSGKGSTRLPRESGGDPDAWNVTTDPPVTTVFSFTADSTEHVVTLESSAGALTVFGISVVSGNWEGNSEPVGIGYPIFTGVLADLGQSFTYNEAKTERYTYTTLAAVDAVSSHANTTRYGAISTGTDDTGTPLGYEPWAARISRIAQSANAPVALPDADLSAELSVYQWAGDSNGIWALQPLTTVPPVYEPDDAFQWSRGYDAAARAMVNYFYLPPGDSVMYEDAITSLYGQLPALTPGVEYTFRCTISPRPGYGDPDYGTLVPAITDFYVDGSTAQDTVHVNSSTGGYIELTFTAGTGAHHVRAITEWHCPAAHVTDGGELRFSAMALSTAATENDGLLQDVVYESSLVNHFDLACDSVGARWWIDTYGITQFRRQLDAATPITRLSDETSDAIHYTDIQFSLDTRNTVNVLVVTQHGAALDTDGNLAANDYTDVYQDAASIRRWGARADSLDMSLYSPTGVELLARERQLVSNTRRPIYAASVARWNAQEDPTRSALLDIYSRVVIENRGTQQSSRIVGIEHEISAYRWMITAYFTDSTVGATNADVNTAYSGKTNAQVNAANAGRTNIEVNLDPLPEA